MRRLNIGLGVVIALGSWLLWPRAEAPRDAALPQPSSALGLALDYQVEATATTRVQLVGEAEVTAELAFRGALTVTPIRQTADGRRVELRWRPRALTWTGLGATADAAQTQAMLARHLIRATWGADGLLRDFSYPPAAPASLASLTELLLGELVPPIATSEGPTGFGEAHTTITPHGRVQREGGDYAQLAGVPPALATLPLVGAARGRVVRTDGRLQRSEMHETLAIDDPDGPQWSARFEGKLLLAGTRAPQRIQAAAFVPRAALLGGAERRALEGRVGTLTFAKLQADLAAFGRGGRLPDHNRAVWQAAGLLRLHPERCADLVALYADPDMTRQGKALLLDILVATGHAEAQAAMRSMLVTDDVTARAFGLRMQRFTLIREPTAESVAFIEDAVAQADSSGVRRAGNATLGAMAYHLRDSDPARAREIGVGLESALRASADPGERAALLTALGNTRSSARAGTIAAGLRGASVDERVAAVDALEYVDAPQARQALIDALADPSGSVRHSAAVRLGRQPFGPNEMAALAAGIADAPLQPGEVDALIGTLQGWAGQGIDVSPAYRALGARSDLTRRARNRIRGALRRG